VVGAQDPELDENQTASGVRISPYGDYRCGAIGIRAQRIRDEDVKAYILRRLKSASKVVKSDQAALR
jgi:hypothetical protein